LNAGKFWLLLAQRGHRQGKSRKRPQITAARSGDLKLPDAAALIAADSLEVKKESLERRQAAENVIRLSTRQRLVQFTN